MTSLSLNKFKNPFALLLVIFLASCSCSNNAPIRDLTVPEVTSTTPANNSKNAVINTFVNVTFSEKMNSNSINDGSFQLFDGSGNNINAEIRYSGTSATLKPTQSLQKLANYSVKLSRSIKDVAGNQIVEDYIWPFTTGTREDDEGPSVNDVFPYEYTSEVPLNTNIIITLNEAVSASSVNETSFTVTDINLNPVSGVFTVEDQKITFNPDNNLAFNTKYTITLSTDIQDLAGNGLSTEYITQFTTVNPTDTTPPLVNSVSPVNNSTDVSLNENIIVSFSEDMNPSSFDTSSFKVTDGNGQQIDGTLEITGGNAIFDPSLPFANITVYTVTLTTNLHDTVGNQLQQEFSWQFTSGSNNDNEGPKVTFINPEANAIDVASNNAITATFSEEINPLTLTKSTMTLVSNAELVDADVSYSGNTAIFRPKRILANNTTYTATLSAFITDLAGNPMEEPYTWVFTTGITPDRDIPSVSSVYPENESTGIAMDNAIVARFSEAMDPASINADSFILADSDNQPVVGVMKTIGASVTFRPLQSMNPSSDYTVTITKKATDLASNALEEDYSWSFTTSSGEDTTAPSILSTVPASSSNFAPTNRGLIVVFSEIIDFESINSSTFFLTDTSGELILGNINYAGDTVTFMPNSNLDFSTSYVATLTTDIKDMSGNALSLVHSWSFTTGTEVDKQAPVITSTLPASDARAIAETQIVVNFDKDMDILSLNTGNIRVRDEKNVFITGTVSGTSQSAILTPSTRLDYDTNYFVTVTTGVRDLSRNHLTTDYAWSFKTSLHPDEAAPFVVSTTPYETQEKVKVSSTIEVLFSEAIDCTSVNNSNFTLTRNTITVTGNVTCSGSIVTFTPTDALATDSNFVATLDTTILDENKTALEETFMLQFSTAPWTQEFGSISSDQARAITTDQNDDVYTTGITNGNLAGLTQGSIDFFITKHSKNSSLTWSNQFGSTSDDYISDVKVAADGNIYLTGYTYGDFKGINSGGADIIVMKLNSNGVELWRKQMGTAQDDVATSLAIDSNGDLILAGYSFAGFDIHLSNGMHDIVVIKLSNDGAQVWSQQLGTITSDIANDIVVDNSNNIYITGYTQGDIAGSGSAGSSDIFVLKLDTNNVLQWTKQIGGILDDRAQSIAIDSSANVYLSGFTSHVLDGNTHFGSTDQFLLKYDTSGTLIWSTQVGSDEDDRAYGVTVDNNDDVIMTGYTYGDISGTNAGDFDLSVIKLDKDATELWKQQIGTAVSDLSFNIAHDSDNNVYITGHSQGEIDGNKNAGFDDIIIMKWDESGIKQ